MRFNINDRVRVRLTARGKEILRQQYVEQRSVLRASPYTHVPPFSLRDEDAEGWSEWQLWELMTTFGPHLYCGSDIPFETEIEIVT